MKKTIKISAYITITVLLVFGLSIFFQTLLTTIKQDGGIGGDLGIEGKLATVGDVLFQGKFTVNNVIEVADSIANEDVITKGWAGNMIRPPYIEGSNADICANLPQVANIKVNNILGSNISLNKNGFINLTFNSKVDSQQLPLVMYAIDWGDNEKTVVSGVEMRDRSNVDNPHSIYHLYNYWDLKAKHSIDQENNSVYCGNAGSVPQNYDNVSATGVSCPANSNCCVIQPGVKIKDNWGWCNNGVDNNICPIGGYQMFDGWIIIRYGGSSPACIPNGTCDVFIGNINNECDTDSCEDNCAIYNGVKDSTCASANTVACGESIPRNDCGDLCPGIGSYCEDGTCEEGNCVSSCDPTCASANTVACGESIPRNDCGDLCPGIGSYCEDGTCEEGNCVSSCDPTCASANTVACGESIPNNDCGDLCPGIGSYCEDGTCEEGNCVSSCDPTCASANTVACGESIPNNDCGDLCPGIGSYCEDGTCEEGNCVSSCNPDCSTCENDTCIGETCIEDICGETCDGKKFGDECPCEFYSYGKYDVYYSCSWMGAQHCMYEGQSQVSAYCSGGFKEIKCNNEGVIQSNGECCDLRGDSCTDDVIFFGWDGYSGQCTLVETAIFHDYYGCGWEPGYCVNDGQSFKDAWCADGNKYVECYNTNGTFSDKGCSL